MKKIRKLTSDKIDVFLWNFNNGPRTNKVEHCRLISTTVPFISLLYYGAHKCIFLLLILHRALFMFCRLCCQQWILIFHREFNWDAATLADLQFIMHYISGIISALRSNEVTMCTCTWRIRSGVFRNVASFRNLKSTICPFNN